MARGRPKEFDEGEALEKALGVFWSRGFGATAISDLTEAMGIGRQSLYDTFGDKRELFLRALESYCRAQHATLAEVLTGQGTPGERLGRFLDLWGEMFEGPMRNGCLIVGSMAEFACRGDREVLDRMGREHERILALLEGVLGSAVESGELDDSLDPRALAETIASTAQGLSLSARTTDAAPAARRSAQTFKTLLGL